MENLLSQGIELAVFGMGTVFVFLALLILATKFMSALVLKYQPDQQSPKTARAVTQTSNNTLLAIISAAIIQHRQQNK
ncbi:MAG: OadG family protein [Proteobacteria bacterium]|nr:OadG family protein [Pseudomonadota bacterium]